MSWRGEYFVSISLWLPFFVETECSLLLGSTWYSEAKCFSSLGSHCCSKAECSYLPGCTMLKRRGMFVSPWVHDVSTSLRIVSPWVRHVKARRGGRKCLRSPYYSEAVLPHGLAISATRSVSIFPFHHVSVTRSDRISVCTPHHHKADRSCPPKLGMLQRLGVFVYP